MGRALAIQAQEPDSGTEETTSKPAVCPVCNPAMCVYNPISAGRWKAETGQSSASGLHPSQHAVHNINNKRPCLKMEGEDCYTRLSSSLYGSDMAHKCPRSTQEHKHTDVH